MNVAVDVPEYADIDDSGCSPRLRAAQREARDRAEIMCLLRRRGPLKSIDIAQHFGGTGLCRTRERTRCSRLLTDLLDEGFVEHTGRGVAGSPRVWSVK